MISCKTLISVNGEQPVECLPITHEGSLALCETGVTTNDLAAVRLELDDHDELVVVRVAETPVILERSGRKLQLRAGKAVRICENDVLRINASSICLVKSTFLIPKATSVFPWLQTTRRILAASAAVFTMTVLCACEEEEDQSIKNVSCVQGVQKCAGNKVMTCQNGVWRLSQTCLSDEICVESNTSAVCEMSMIAGDMRVDECEPNQMKCENNNVYKCEGGFWELSQKCLGYDICTELSNTSAVCESGVTSGILPPQKECKNDEMKCDNNNVYKCVGGFWQFAEACDLPDVCVERSNTSAVCEMSMVDGDMQIDECDPDQMKCENNSVYKCEGGLWQLADACEGGSECVQVSNTSAFCDMGPTAGVLPIEECQPGEMKCDNNNVYQCSGGLWQLADACEGGSECIQVSNTSAFCDMGPTAGVLPVEECQPGEMKCEDNSVYKCEGGLWQLADACEGGSECVQVSNTSAFCDMGPTSGVLPVEECQPGEMKCEDNSVYKCDFGYWALANKCEEDAVCVELSNTSAVCEVDVTEGEMIPPECDDGAMKCDNNSVYKCEYGYWALANKCEGDAICVERSNTSAVCEVDVLEGEPLPPPEIPNPEPPSDKS